MIEKNLTKLISKEIANQSEDVLKNRTKEMKIAFKVEGQAIVKKGEDFEQIVSFAIPYDKIVAVLLSKLNGVTVNSVLKEALSGDISTDQIKAEASEALREIKGTSKRKMSGKLSVKSEICENLQIEVCEFC